MRVTMHRRGIKPNLDEQRGHRILALSAGEAGRMNLQWLVDDRQHRHSSG